MKDFSLYVITGEQFYPHRHYLEVIEEAIQGGADMVQLREKKKTKRELLDMARQLKALCDRYKVPFIVNDHVDIALAVDADGVHLGQDDLPLEEARKILGPDKIIGISTHNLEEAKRAEEGGADYIGVGPVFPTNTKEDVVDPVGLEYVRQVVEHIRIPFVAIGGIKLHNVDQVLKAGAKRISIVSAIVGAENVKEAARAFARKLETVR
ncbi:thiamine-phosphate synthase [Caldalkalibacillus thermarum]|uniref:thiamine phosphate synthase n=1 Tax=Caldalkalibacillus thermarum TaxID=296745 RepID=UPI00166AE4AA|nr:thiamine phosphate synthase [Caldalkalibacillus thermarum]GGK20320.1 thiamine-phosphate synthase [Caldalkalibacillus thermarum]